MKQAWLKELYRQWTIARGNQVVSRTRAFRRNWDKLLNDAGLHSAEDQKAAQRAAEQHEAKGHIKLHRKKARKNIILKIELPLVSESWLLAVFNQRPPAENQNTSLSEVETAEARRHGKYPELWAKWCGRVKSAFAAGKNMRPLFWKSPESVKTLLALIYRLTSLDLHDGALIREVSKQLGLGSKDLEKRQRIIEACLGQMFGRQMTLETMGIVLTDSRSDLAGTLVLHFPNNETQEINKLKEVYSLSLGDLERAEYATTTASRLLTVENSKTTLRRLASFNSNGDTLLAACAFPTKALLKLIELLPRNFPLFHFGDTDPAGYHVLSKLRETTRKSVQPFLMKRRPAKEKCPLTEYDQGILPRLLNDPLLQDVKPHIEEIKNSGCKGDFEQEGLGLPDLKSWPFFSQAKLAEDTAMEFYQRTSI
jgi:hypothetical protein